MAKAQKAIFYLLILFLPTQLGRHFWPPQSFIFGLRVDYLSPTIYFTDILIILLLIFWVAGDSRDFLTRGPRKNLILIFTLGIFLIAGILKAENPLVGFYKLVKTGEFLFLGIYLAQKINFKKDLPKIANLLAFGVIFESGLALGQFFKQGSVGGIFWWFGERTFTSGTPGIAQAVLDGQLILRPYGTFPHPNVLAGFLVVSLILILASWLGTGGIFRWLKSLALGLGLVTLFLTFSRAAWLVGILAIGASFVWLLLVSKKSFAFKNTWPKVLGIFFLALLIIYFLFPAVFSRFQSLRTTDQSALVVRQELNQAAWGMIQSSPVLGVGLNNFLGRLPEFLPSQGVTWVFQPAHNLYLLIAAETGLVGLGAFFWLLLLTYKNLLRQQFLLISLTAILILGAFDHYFYTLQQGQLLATLVFGLVWSTSKTR